MQQDELFADEIGNIAFEGGVMRLTLISREPGLLDKDNKPQMSFRQRVIMPVEGFLKSHRLMTEMLEKMEQTGVVARRPAPGQENLAIPEQQPAATAS